MEFLSAEWFSALLSIIVIDLVLAGDNAIVIGMAARNLPKNNQKKVILWGTVGAIAIRIVATLVVVWLLRIPGLLLIGGILLLWIAYKLLVEEKEHNITAKDSLWAAIKTIIIADALMGMDNVLAVAGAAHGSFDLVVIGLIVSVPIVVWGSTLFVKLISKYPVIVYAGSGVLAFTAVKMAFGEPFLESYAAALGWGKYVITIAIVALVLYLGLRKKKQVKAQPATGN